MAQTKDRRPLVQPGQMMPRVRLDGPAGSRHLTGSGTRSTLLVFLHPEPCDQCRAFLDEVTGCTGALKEWATSLVAVVPPGTEAADRGFPVLHDDGEARGQLGIGRDEAAVLLADRWGEVVEVAAISGDHRFPLPGQLVESAKILDLSCGECNVPAAEWR